MAKHCYVCKKKLGFREWKLQQKDAELICLQFMGKWSSEMSWFEREFYKEWYEKEFQEKFSSSNQTFENTDAVSAFFKLKPHQKIIQGGFGSNHNDEWICGTCWNIHLVEHHIIPISEYVKYQSKINPKKPSKEVKNWMEWINGPIPIEQDNCWSNEIGLEGGRSVEGSINNSISQLAEIVKQKSIDVKKPCGCCKKLFIATSLDNYGYSSPYSSVDEKFELCTTCKVQYSKVLSNSEKLQNLRKELSHAQNKSWSADYSRKSAGKVKDEAGDRALFDTVTNLGNPYTTDPQIQHNKNYADSKYSDALSASVEADGTVDLIKEEISDLYKKLQKQFLADMLKETNPNSINPAQNIHSETSVSFESADKKENEQNFCENCGNALKFMAKFCGKCGTKRSE